MGHVLIALAEAHLNGGLLRTMPGVTTVDEIGLRTLIIAFFVPQVAKPEVCRRLAIAAILVLGVTWLVNLYWLPNTDTGRALEAAIIGGDASSRALAIHAPMVQHVSIYLLGLPLGQFFAQAIAGQMPTRKVARKFAIGGALLAGAALALHNARPMFDFLTPVRVAALDATLRITQKIPPSPMHLLFYGGCGLLVIATMCFAAGSTRRSPSSR